MISYVMFAIYTKHMDSILRRNIILIILLYKKRQQRLIKEPCRNSILTGHGHVQMILNGNPIICHQLLRMEQHVFRRLCMYFREKNLLKDTRYILVEEQLAMFMMVIAHAHTNRVIQDRFQHSGETIHRHFRQVLIAMMIFAKDKIKPHPLDTVPKEILLNPHFEPYFKVLLSFLDNTFLFKLNSFAIFLNVDIFFFYRIVLVL